LRGNAIKAGKLHKQPKERQNVAGRCAWRVDRIERTYFRADETLTATYCG